MYIIQLLFLSSFYIFNSHDSAGTLKEDVMPLQIGYESGMNVKFTVNYL